MPTPSQVRLYARVAERSDRIVLLLRMRQDLFRLILWDTATDTFTPGQWLNKTLQSQAWDISPDGEYLIYSVRDDGLYWLNPPSATEVAPLSVAVSRPPYFTAIAIGEAGPRGEGRFASDGRLLLSSTRFVSTAGEPPFAITETVGDAEFERAALRGFDEEYVNYIWQGCTGRDQRWREVLLGPGTVSVRESDTEEWRQIADFSESEFEEVEVPDWAKTWTSTP